MHVQAIAKWSDNVAQHSNTTHLGGRIGCVEDRQLPSTICGYSYEALAAPLTAHADKIRGLTHELQLLDYVSS